MLAFAPSLREDYFAKVHAPQPRNFINPLETVQSLQQEGWQIEGVSERYGSNRKVDMHQVRMWHPDIAMKAPSGKIEGTSNLYVTNDFQTEKMTMALGMYRLVCKNGLVAFAKDNYTINSEDQIQQVLTGIEKEAQQMMNGFRMLKEIQLPELVQRDLAKEALRIRFGGGMAYNIEPSQLLKLNRDEDAGSDVWHVYNRVQENLIKPAMLRNKQNVGVNGVFDLGENIRINQALYEKMVMPYLS